MNILCCLDNGYTYQMMNMIYSVKKKSKDDINVYLITSNFTVNNETLISDFCKKHGISFNIYREELVDGFNDGNKHYTVDMFLRIFAFNILPLDINRILYLDADLIANKDLSALYYQNLDDRSVAVVRDVNYDSDELLKHAADLEINHDYFNSGVILFNLDNIRKKWNVNTIVELIKEKSSHLKFPDQDILNILLDEKDIVFMEKTFNYQILSKGNLDCEPHIIHFIGAMKPWNHFLLSKHEKKYSKNFKELGQYKYSFKQFFIKLKILIRRIFKKVKKFFN